MNIKYETRITERLWAKPADSANIDRFEHGIDAYLILILNQIGKIDGIPIHKDEIYLTVRNTQRFDQVLDCYPALEMNGEFNLATIRWKKVAQFGVETEKCTVHPEQLSM